MLRALVLFFFSFLAACVAPQHFERGDNSESQFMKDQAECEFEGEKARTTGGFGGLAGVAEHEESFARVFNACMKARGYKASGS